MITALLAVETGNLQDRVVTSKAGSKITGSRVYLTMEEM
jgi:F0F1-type ATP synthase beta subunit